MGGVCRSSQPSSAQPPQPGVADAGQDQSKAGAAGNAGAQPVWNPFDDDNFSNIPAEEVKHEDKKPAGKTHTATHDAHTEREFCQYTDIGKEKQKLVFLDTPSELEQTSCEELIPGLQASAVDNVPQESGMSHAPASCLL